MPARARADMACDSNLYHVTARGVGRRDIFEDDDDRRRFIRLLEGALRRTDVSTLAWCLMENHVHLLFRARLDAISACMSSLLTSYAMGFNHRHDHVGHVFQGRFGSQAIATEPQLLATVRYIHQNPVAAGATASCDYRWSSWQDYLRTGKGPGITETSTVLGLFGSLDAFVAFHREFADGAVGDCRPTRSPHSSLALAEDEARRLATELLGGIDVTEVALLDKRTRDTKLRLLRKNGLSIRQIERLTGAGRGIIARAKPDG